LCFSWYELGVGCFGPQAIRGPLIRHDLRGFEKKLTLAKKTAQMSKRLVTAYCTVAGGLL
jgi:hypothetical protein